ncbi:haloacid dehalogenase type II [Aureimonas jatrophae]|uniref:2-haloacid dehalogenase n=1 Tax=Aureimonas jatrophae TaxID=1166073 RepID=A0A1H0F6T4_9HYPH|nr:haloacid dehalogenase type II [Aureimonas jatrophae]MBB3950154.1 2-haloacid dehalogenase [Aureimonas jatrophae]SDN90291.1 2-haloacid dehalogenase [Aureimonas jatrophae]
MLSFTPRFVSFDCYGTLIHFGMAALARELFAARIPAGRMDRFLADFKAFRLDEVLGPFKPYREVIGDALARTARLHGIATDEHDLDALYRAIPTWGPHPDVVPALARIAQAIPVVGLTNSMADLIPPSIAAMQAPFHRVVTAEEAGAYKPRRQAFDYMLDTLGARPEEVVHCSSSHRYDLMTASDLRMGARVLVERGHEPPATGYATHTVNGIDGLARLLGLA